VDFFARYTNEKLGQDGKRRKEEVLMRAYAPRINEDFMSGIRSGVNGTRTLSTIIGTTAVMTMESWKK
jgi:hypothetical protein